MLRWSAPARPELEAPDRLLQPLDLLLLRDVLLLLALQLELAGERVGGVVARPHPDPAPVELGDLADRLVEQVAVVRDGDGGAVEGGEQALQQRAADRVEMSLRLVEEQHVRVLGEAGGERDQLALAAGEGARRQGQVGFLDPDVEQHRAGAAVDARPAGGLPALDELLLPVEDARHLVEVGGELRRGELVRDSMEVAVELVEVGTGSADGLERRSARPRAGAAAGTRRRCRAGAPMCRRPAPRARRSGAASSTCRTRSRRSRRRGRVARSRSRARRARFGCRTTCGRRSG